MANPPKMTADRADSIPAAHNERIILQRAVARLRAMVMALTFGMTGGVGLALATAWLLLRGGENVGQHLALLSNYLPGYSVTWGGAVLGLLYGGLLGGVIGASIAWTYNMIAFSRRGPGRLS
jgi:hypothetical protein